jgi:hypothetical protein
MSDVKRLAGTVLPAGSKVPSGGWVCKNPKCGKLVSGPRKTACDYCGVEKVGVAPKPKSVKTPKVAVKVTVPVPTVEVKPDTPVVPTIPDPYTFTINPTHREFIQSRTGQFESRVIRHTAMLNPAVGVPDKNGKAISVNLIDKLTARALTDANAVDLPNDYNAYMIPVRLADEGFEESDNPVYGPYVDRVDVPRYAVK